MKRIGILLQSSKCSKYLYETVKELSKSESIELFFLLNNDTPALSRWGEIRKMIQKKGFFRTIDAITFKIITSIEYKVLSIFYKSIRDKNHNLDIKELLYSKEIYLTPIFSDSGLIVRYSGEDINNVKQLDLDIILRGNAPGIFKGDIINSAKEGIISFHHGDNRWNRGGPPGFWEVQLRKDFTGFIIQVLTEELDGGSVIFRGNLSTKRSYTENIIELYNTSNPYLAKILLQYAKTGVLPSPEENLPHSGALLVTPSFTQSMLYLLKTGALFFSLALKEIILRKRKKWGIAFVKSSWRNTILRKGIKVKNPKGRFFADPFVISKDAKTVCYVEDYSYSSKKGCITAIEIIGDKEYKILGPVIEEPFHMSFPFIFEYKNELYMIPETSESNSIRLYKCTDFPLKWKYQKDVMGKIKAVDSMVFEHDNKWWLLCNTAMSDMDKSRAALVAFYSESPLSDNWIAHESNPLMVDDEHSRNGGILEANTKSLIRVRQKPAFNFYGKRMSIAKINNLTPSTFFEKEISLIEPDFFKNIKGCHHMHSNGSYTVYDYVKREH